MSWQIGRLAKVAGIEEVHRFRTNSRRVEALVSELGPANGNQKKLLKSLAKLRKKAGRVRDLDVQIAFLKELKIPDRLTHRAQLLDWLTAEKVRRTRKLTKSFDAEAVRELRKRLRRVSSEIRVDGIDPLKLARKYLPEPGSASLSEKMLHAWRVEAKRARYLAEVAPESAESKNFVAELKRAQDAIGEWHDTMKLKETAERMFGNMQASSLVAALQNISRAKFRRATAELFSALAAISPEPREAVAVPLPPKTVKSELEKPAAVA
jgi:CHAD domain-containing protein